RDRAPLLAGPCRRIEEIAPAALERLAPHVAGERESGASHSWPRISSWGSLAGSSITSSMTPVSPTRKVLTPPTRLAARGARASSRSRKRLRPRGTKGFGLGFVVIGEPSRRQRLICVFQKHFVNNSQQDAPLVHQLMLGCGVVILVSSRVVKKYFLEGHGNGY